MRSRRVISIALAIALMLGGMAVFATCGGLRSASSRKGGIAAKHQYCPDDDDKGKGKSKSKSKSTAPRKSTSCRPSATRTMTTTRARRRATTTRAGPCFREGPVVLGGSLAPREAAGSSRALAKLCLALGSSVYAALLVAARGRPSIDNDQGVFLSVSASVLDGVLGSTRTRSTIRIRSSTTRTPPPWPSATGALHFSSTSSGSRSPPCRPYSCSKRLGHHDSWPWRVWSSTPFCLPAPGTTRVPPCWLPWPSHR